MKEKEENSAIADAPKEKVKDQNKVSWEPVLNDNEVKWLCVTDKEIIPVVPGRTITDMIKNPLSTEKIRIFATQDPDIWKCNKCGTLIKPSGTPAFCEGCERDSTFTRITDSIDPDLWKLPMWKDIAVEDIDMQNVFLDIEELIKKCIIFPEELHYKIYALWIISTWKSGCWETVPFLIFRGLVETGKTRALDFIRMLGYRSIQASGISIKAIFRFGDIYGANILLDEIDNKIDPRTETGREMMDYLKPSYRVGSYYYAADREDPKKIQKYKNFGFKAFAGEKGGYDPAMFSRAIDFQMEQDYPEITELKTLNTEFERLRSTLLNYRYKTNNPPELPETIVLKGRIREIYTCIIRTALHIGIEINDILEFINQTELEKQEEAESSDEYAVLKVIKEMQCMVTLDDAPETIAYSEIAERLGWEEEKRQKVGYIFKKKLMLKTKRMNKGYVVLLNDPRNIRKLKSLYRRFHIHE